MKHDMYTEKKDEGGWGQKLIEVGGEGPAVSSIMNRKTFSEFINTHILHSKESF